ncbi:acyl-CoA dehydrogenase family protein [Nocardia thailandica]|uniref:Acyl-CoA dehydrogenase family protein n=1 Tax=Nocardia thailandica TaxID=257275 RepID=A0ABW6PGL0_9NOCA|nr:acyl-CoA dehydrogenase family protein [Nocardia thailandica]
MEFVFDHLLRGPADAPAPTGVDGVWDRYRAVAGRFAGTVDDAAAAGFAADRLGFAFLPGYQAALRALLPGLDPGALVSMLATEQGGGHPAAIATTLTETADGWRVTGTKSFATLGDRADRFVVVASTGAGPDGRNRLRAALVAADAPGVRVEPLPELPFAPEIPHASVRFDEVAAEPLPGDGYTDLLKPFRTVEDVHVLAATLGYLIRVARGAAWPDDTVERLLALLAGVRGIEPAAYRSPGAHVALGGLFGALNTWVADTEPLWARVDEAQRRRWERDRPLLGVAGKVRAQRLATAWRTVRPAGE